MNASLYNKLFLCAAMLVMGILAGTSAKAQSRGIPAWTNLYNGPGNYDDYVNAIAVDTSGNVFVSGGVDGGSSYDFATIKYSNAGQLLWINLYNGPADESDGANGMAVDSSGNVIVTGYSVASGSYSDFATIKYSGAGVPLWTNGYSGPGSYDDGANAVAVDTNGNVFVTGESYSTNGTPYNYDYATIKYSSAGTALWTNRYSGPTNGDDRAIAVAVDGSGNVFVTGSSARSTAYPYDYDFATIKYSGTGVALWTNRYNGPGNSDDSARALAVDGSGNVIVTGGSGSDYATIKYSGAGVALWTNRYNGPANAFDHANAVAVDGGGNVFVTGGAGVDYDAADSHYATIKYSGAGVPLWTNRYPQQRGLQDAAYGMAVDGSGNVIVTGTSINSGTFHDCATIKYSGAGVPLWTNCYNGSGNDYDSGTAVAVDASGNVFVTGLSYEQSSAGYDFVTIKYAVAPLLSIGRTTTNTVALSSPSPWTGFTLQQNTNSIATVNWSNVLTTPTDNGTTKTVIVNLPTGNRFYRLKSQ